MRRRLIRGLRYFLLGEELENKRSSIIVDPVLRNAAEKFKLPISSRLIYDILVMLLLEQEGLLKDVAKKSHDDSVAMICSLFGSAHNKYVGMLTMALKSPLEKFVVANRLYGREDPMDKSGGELFGKYKKLAGSAVN
jgi:hypothetical protein